MADIDLQFIASQQKQLLDRMASLEGQLTVLTGICIRLDGSVAGLTTTTNGVWQLLNRMEQRLRALEPQL